jgi:UDP-N-acetylmuramoylalanine-D-glutamate ligase
LRELLAGRRGVSWFGAAAGFHVRNGAVHERTGRKVAVPPPELPGRHNLLNLCAALSLADMVGVRHPDLPGALGSFRGLPHRLQRLGRRGGLAFYDDSMATTPVATLAALEALSGRRITLIFGGQRQDIDWTKPIEQLRGRNLHAMIAIPDSGPEIAALARSKGVRPVAGIHATGGLAEAVRLATELSAPGGTVLLSPGAPSFPRFRDFADRGDQFAGLAGFARDDDNGRPGRGQKEEIAGQG